VSFSRAPRSEIPAVYTEADAVLFPVQWEEPWGLVPLEAMAIGRPVVATGTGGSAEYLEDEANCLLFRPRDSPRALAAAVTRLSADPALRSKLREQGLRTAARFTETAYNEAIRLALEEAVAGSLVASRG
jgi:glycosyltransferase involved in cell wall biosynthesis